MLINLELLRSFAEAAAAPSFAAAAARRRVTPSAVSQQIKALEGQLGVPLFERLGRRVRLSESGARLLAAVRGPLAGLDDALAGLIEAHGAVAGEVGIGGPGPFSRWWLRPRLVGLLRAHPALVLEVSFDVPSRLARRLLEGECDLCLLVSPVEHAGLEQHLVHVEEFVAVAAPAYLRRHGTPGDARALAEHRYIVYDGDLAMHAAWWRACCGRRAPLPTGVACRIASLDEMLALARAGLGITVLPSYFVAEALAAGQVVEVAPAAAAARRGRTAKNPIHLAWRAGAGDSARVRAVRAALLAPGPPDGILPKDWQGGPSDDGAGAS